EAGGRGHFGEGAVTIVVIQAVGGAEPAEVEIEPAVVVHIGEGGTLFPDSGVGPGVAHAGTVGDVLEPEVAEVAEEPAAFGFADDEDVGATVAIVVPDGDARTDGTDFKLVV